MPGDLFNFNLSIEPILDVIVGKCLDQGSSEVIQEQTLKVIQAHHAEYKSRKMAAAEESKRLTTESLRRFEAKETLLRERRARHIREHILAQKVGSRNMSLNFVAGLQNLVLGRLEHSSFFHDPLKYQVRQTFFPWLMAEVDKELGRIQGSRDCVDTMVKDTIKLVGDEQQKQKEYLQSIIDLEEAKHQAIRDEQARIIGIQEMRAKEDADFLEEVALHEAKMEEERLAEEAAEREDEEDGGDDESSQRDVSDVESDA